MNPKRLLTLLLLLTLLTGCMARPAPSAPTATALSPTPIPTAAPPTATPAPEQPEETGLPAANVLIYALEGGATVVVRPSGTEPKIKTYFTTLGKDIAEAQAQKDKLAQALKPILA